MSSLYLHRVTKIVVDAADKLPGSRSYARTLTITTDQGEFEIELFGDDPAALEIRAVDAKETADA